MLLKHTDEFFIILIYIILVSFLPSKILYNK